MDCALVLGAEGKGVHDLVRKHCDFLVSIPMLGKVPSLNVSVAGGLYSTKSCASGVLRRPRRIQAEMKVHFALAAVLALLTPVAALDARPSPPLTTTSAAH